MNCINRRIKLTNEEELTEEVKGIINKHLTAIVSDVEWKLSVYIDNYTELFCKCFENKMLECFKPHIQLKTKNKE